MAKAMRVMVVVAVEGVVPATRVAQLEASEAATEAAVRMALAGRLTEVAVRRSFAQRWAECFG